MAGFNSFHSAGERYQASEDAEAAFLHDHQEGVDAVFYAGEVYKNDSEALAEAFELLRSGDHPSAERMFETVNILRPVCTNPETEKSRVAFSCGGSVQVREV